VTVAQSRPCVDSASVLQESNARIETSATSVAFDGCVNIFLNIISANGFREAQTVKLSSNLASFKKPEEYAAHNRHGGVIGNLVGNGIEVKVDGTMNDYTVCLTRDQSNHPGSPSY
jgi:hypothetical protein